MQTLLIEDNGISPNEVTTGYSLIPEEILPVDPVKYTVASKYY